MSDDKGKTVQRMTNARFGASIGVTESYASYIRSGDRRPSGDVLLRIIRVYSLDPATTMDAYSAGADTFSALIRREVFKFAE